MGLAESLGAAVMLVVGGGHAVWACLVVYGSGGGDGGLEVGGSASAECVWVEAFGPCLVSVPLYLTLGGVVDSSAALSVWPVGPAGGSALVC